jgi:hypothetical protein
MRKRFVVDDATVELVREALRSGEEPTFWPLLVQDLEKAGQFYERLVANQAGAIYDQLAPYGEEGAEQLMQVFRRSVFLVIAAVWFERQQWYSDATLPVLTNLEVDAYVGGADAHEVNPKGYCERCHAQAEEAKEWLQATAPNPTDAEDAPLFAAVAESLEVLEEEWMQLYIGDAVYSTIDLFALALERDPAEEREPDVVPPEDTP